MALIAIAVVLAVTGGGGGSSGPAAQASSPHFAAPGDLATLGRSLDHPVYWAGKRPPARLELTEEPSGNIYVRYLPPGVRVGQRPAAFLTVGTYALANAVASTRRAAARSGARLISVGGGGVAFASPESRGSAYLAYPDADLQVEVYDPTPGRSLALIRAGAIRPMGG